jgi:hypothetical protein
MVIIIIEDGIRVRIHYHSVLQSRFLSQISVTKNGKKMGKQRFEIIDIIGILHISI